MKITHVAMSANRLTLFTAVLLLIAGIATFLNLPSQEEPSVTVRDTRYADISGVSRDA